MNYVTDSQNQSRRWCRTEGCHRSTPLLVVAVAILVSACTLGYHPFKETLIDEQSPGVCKNHGSIFVQKDDQLLVKHAYAARSLISNVCVIDEEGEEGAKMSFAVIEFDDDGNHWNRRQLDLAIGAIKKAQERVLLVVYVHGWLASANERDESLSRFRWFVNETATNNRVCTIYRRNRDSACSSRPHVFGVYIAWRGNPLAQIPKAGYLTFWNRRSAARKVAGTAMTETLFRLFDALEHADGLRQDEGRPDSPDSTLRSRSVVIGHSMGAYILERAFAQSFVGVRSTVRRHYGRRLQKSIESTRDQIDERRRIERQVETRGEEKKTAINAVDDLEEGILSTRSAIDSKHEAADRIFSNFDMGSLFAYENLWIPRLYREEACAAYDGDRVQACAGGSADVRIVGRCIAREFGCVYETHQCAASKALDKHGGKMSTWCDAGGLDHGGDFEPTSEESLKQLREFRGRIADRRSTLVSQLSAQFGALSPGMASMSIPSSLDHLLEDSQRIIDMLEKWQIFDWGSPTGGDNNERWSERLDSAFAGAQGHIERMLSGGQTHLESVKQASKGAGAGLASGSAAKGVEDYVRLWIPRVTEDEIGKTWAHGIVAPVTVGNAKSNESEQQELLPYSRVRVQECVEESQDMRILARCIATELRRTLMGYQCSILDQVLDVDVVSDQMHCGEGVLQGMNEGQHDAAWTVSFLENIDDALRRLDAIVAEWPSIHRNGSRAMPEEICTVDQEGQDRGRVPDEIKELSDWLEDVDLLDRDWFSWLKSNIAIFPEGIAPLGIPEEVEGMVLADLEAAENDVSDQMEAGRNFLCDVANAAGKRLEYERLHREIANLKKIEQDQVLKLGEAEGRRDRSIRELEKLDVDLEAVGARLGDLSRKILIETDGALNPPGDVVLFVNAAAEAMSARSLMQAMCSTKGEAKDVLMKASVEVDEDAILNWPWIVSVTSEGDFATRHLFPLGVRVGRLLGRAAGRRWAEPSSGVDHECEYDVGSFGELAIRTAGHHSAIHSHEVECYGGDNGEFDERIGDQLDDHRGMRAFSFDIGGGRTCEMKSKDGATLSAGDYWVATIPNEIVRGHGDVLNRPMHEMMIALLVRSGALERPCVTVDGGKVRLISRRSDGCTGLAR